MRIKVEKPSAEAIAEMKSCPTWSKKVSIFDWEYDAPKPATSWKARSR